MLKTHRTHMLYATAALLFVVSDAYASGFQLKEQGAAMQGLSFAGATAKADDLSTLFFNPAGMTRLKGNQAEANLSLIAPSAKFKIDDVTGVGPGGIFGPSAADGAGGDAGKAAVVPAIYGMWDLRPDLKFGLSINTPFGLATEYKDGWVGRYYALESELMTVNISPLLAYKVNDKLSIGGGLQVEYAEAKLTKAVNVAAATATPGTPDGKVQLEGDNIGYGFSLGALYEFDEDTRAGISYRSRVNHKLKGDLTFTNTPAAAAFADAAAQAGISMPDVLSVGVYHGLNDKWAVMADASWTNWSLFQDLTVTNTSDGTVRESVEEKWNDSYFVSVGTEYKPNDKQVWQFGIAFDQSPVSTEFRTFRIPDNNRFWISVGYGQKLDEKSEIRVGYSHIFANTANVTEDSAASGGSVSGHYSANVNILSVGYRRRF